VMTLSDLERSFYIHGRPVFGWTQMKRRSAPPYRLGEEVGRNYFVYFCTKNGYCCRTTEAKNIAVYGTLLDQFPVDVRSSLPDVTECNLYQW